VAGAAREISNNHNTTEKRQDLGQMRTSAAGRYGDAPIMLWPIIGAK